MKKEKVYLAGPLFTEYEIEARKREHKMFKEAFPHIDTFAPIDAPFNGGNPTNKTIFETDYKEMNESNIFIFDLNNNDPGTIMELGLAIERKKQGDDIELYAFVWDLRMGRNIENAGPFDKPYGLNGFMVGGIQKYGKLVHTFEDVIKEMKKIRA